MNKAQLQGLRGDPVMAPNQVVRKLGTLILLAENDKTPSDEEWDEFLAIFVKYPSEMPRMRILIFTSGGSPSAAQRKRLQSTLRGVRFRTAVVSDSITVRFVASTIALFHRDHRSFSSAEWNLAYDHLQLPESERGRADKEMREMRLMLA